MNNLVQFNNHSIELIQHNGQAFISGTQIGRVIELAQRDGVAKIYNRHREEFTDDMTTTVRCGKSTIRIFNREGAWLIGMFARTPKAAEFRKWVLKVLGTVADYQLPTAQIDMRAIGGLVKKCCAVAVREELNAILASDQQADWEVSDKDLLFQLYRWHNTKNKAETAEFRRLHAENDALLAENTQLKERNKKAVKLLEEK